MATQVTYNTEDVLAAVFQYKDSEFEEESSDQEGSDLKEVSDIDMSESGEESASEDENNYTTRAQTAGSGRQRVRNPRRARTVFRLNWEAYEDVDPFESNWLPVYQRPRSILVDTNDFKPVDYFSLFFPDEAFDLMSEETNRYAMQYLDTTADFSENSRFQYWSLLA